MRRILPESNDPNVLQKVSQEIYSGLDDTPRKSLYEIQVQQAEELKNLREQYEQSQREQVAKDSRLEKENQFNRRLAIASFVVSVLATLFTVITTLVR